MRRLNNNDLLPDEPAKWDCFDIAGTLMLRRGETITSKEQLNWLLNHGLYAKQPAGASPFGLMAEVEVRLRVIFSALIAGMPRDFHARIIDIVRDLQRICEIDADAALGMLHLNSESRYTIIHPLHVAILCELITRRREMDAESRLSVVAAALTSNIAMIELQESLQKQVSPLTAGQAEKIRTHPVQAADMLREAGVQDELWISAVLQHHERLDGKGYPGALKDKDISLPARILSLSDTYGALISPRSYRSAGFSNASLHEIFLKRGAATDEFLPQFFVEELGTYPPGVFVHLENGETAVVVRRASGAKPPQVISLISRNGTPFPEPLERDCRQKGYAINKIVAPSRGLVINRPLLWGYSD